MVQEALTFCGLMQLYPSGCQHASGLHNNIGLKSFDQLLLLLRISLVAL